MKMRIFAATTVLAGVLLAGVLGLYARTEAAPPSSKDPLPPFAESVQRQVNVIAKLDEMIVQLKEQNRLLKEQNEILKSGKLEVIVKKAVKAN